MPLVEQVIFSPKKYFRDSRPLSLSCEFKNYFKLAIRGMDGLVMIMSSTWTSKAIKVGPYLLVKRK